MKKAIIFDFFGVICSNINYFLADKYLGKDFDYEPFSKQIDLGKFTEEQFIGVVAEKAKQPIEHVLADMKNQILINGQVIELIKKARSKYKIGLLSDADATFLRKILNDHKLAGYFDRIAISSETGFLKPDERAFKFILNALDVEAGQAIFIDDRIANVEAARNLEIESILFRNMDDLLFLAEQLK